QVTRTLQFVPQAFVQAVAGQPSVERSRFADWIQRVADATGRVDLTWATSLSSRFDRETSSPGWLYQLGVGGRDAFRIVGGDTAVAVVATDRFTARSSFRLPGSTQLDVGYGTAESEAFDLRGGARTQADRTWPDLSLTFTRIPLPTALDDVVLRANARAGYVVSRREARYTGGGESRSRDTNIPLYVSVGFGAGLSATYNASLRSGVRRDLTGSVESDYRTHTVSVSGSLPTPAFLSEYLANPINVTGRFDSTHRLECRSGFQSTTGECVRIVDDRSRNADFAVETLVEDLIVGFRLSYWSRASEVGFRSGSSSFEIGLFASFNFTAGTMPAGF
ncbi:MAG TPA: hypothetical protein VNZ57_05550, partial [Longimicrobiales bacterium]|nr:hypothetical protein [Longimicrobiales bacterium]